MNPSAGNQINVDFMETSDGALGQTEREGRGEEKEMEGGME